jgi:genome maintenance exonuclease 1
VKVLNKRVSSDGVYIGRPSKFGNPFVIGKDGSRADVVAKFEHFLQGRPDLIEAAKQELKGQNLVCFCAPLACHGDVLLRYANEGAMKFQYENYDTETVKNMRWYITPAGALPSITTVLGVSEPEEKKASLVAWQNSLGVAKAAEKSKQATEHGTMVHLLAERFLKGEDVDALVNGMPVPGPDKAAFNALKLKLRQINEVWGQEQSIYSPSLEVAGRFDCMGEYKHVPSIIDFKTAGRLKNRKDIEDYELQLAFYAKAHNELYGTDVRQGVILMSAAGGMPQEFIVDVQAKLPELEARIKTFWVKVLADV